MIFILHSSLLFLAAKAAKKIKNKNGTTDKSSQAQILLKSPSVFFFRFTIHESRFAAVKNRQGRRERQENGKKKRLNKKEG